MHPETVLARRRLYLLARVIVVRHYRQELTLATVARALATSPRQLQRAYAQCSEITFHEDLFTRRMNVAAELLVEQRAIPVQAVARLVGYRQGAHFAQAFRRCYGLSPARFRERALERSGEEEQDVARPGSNPATHANAQAAGHPHRAPGPTRRSILSSAYTDE